jgi:probable rRNA maturation factor
MKLRIKIDAQEEGAPPDPLSGGLAGQLDKLESVFEEALPSLCGQAKMLENHAEAEVSLSFLDKAERRDVNKRYRGVDEPTDVLAFPLWEDGQFAPPGALGLLPLGDIVICPEETEREHAPAPPSEALCLVLAHGFLHLLGYDHDTPDKEEDMWKRQELLKTKLMNAGAF